MQHHPAVVLNLPPLVADMHIALLTGLGRHDEAIHAGLYGRRPCTLASPVPFAAADVISSDAERPQDIEFHYAIIEVLKRMHRPLHALSHVRSMPAVKLPARHAHAPSTGLS